ncbi:aminotransferase [Halohasta litchfieldiae]|jgi:aminotransferase|uniref:Aminotransferase n=1 Tax=Halohasta litchfieldiae TaxID=1073996 RepID=A0A1H6XYM9_9EURY|nr:aminotransferase class I/II-fold pyridoxal phosphate-dependent enzyme [Halohasta litchfieldiae]ATW86880.1 aminotransferase [Halohasta litchfieldiae]SEJ29992.1 aminotransferase [Halohasta litchfieldiae]
MTLQPNDRVASVPESGIRKFFELAEERDDVISLGVGEPDFSTPWAARSAAIHSLEEGRTSYTSNRGMADLRRLISDYSRRWDHDYDPDTEVLVTTGASEAVDLALRAFISPGDTVAIHQPNYISYRPGIQFAGGEPLGVPTHAADDFALTPEALAAAGADEADLLVLCYPNNPTGAVMDDEEIAAVAEFCVDNDIAVIADEIYAALTYDGDHTSIASMPGMRERTVVINGFSKAYAMTGLRLGYMLAPADAIESLNRVHQYTMLSAPTTAQYAAIEALRSCEDAVTEMATEYNRRRRFVLSRFEEMGLDCFTSRGAFYAFPKCGGDDEAFAEQLLKEEGVAVVPGSVFGDGGEGHLRVSYATSMRELKTAMNRLETFLQNR